MLGKFKQYWSLVEPDHLHPLMPCCWCFAPKLAQPGWIASPFKTAFTAMRGSEKWAFLEACNAVGLNPCAVCDGHESLIQLRTHNVLGRMHNTGGSTLSPQVSSNN
jgi:hypothetical protein